jgi:diadenosine tetraphosphate (Ap4A) HIT family hydrolase
MKTFADIPAEKVVLDFPHFFVIKDGYPVSPGHCLIISKVVKETFFDLSIAERHELTEAIDDVKQFIETNHSPDGYNIGMNCGETAGQTVMHFHCHVIPRYEGDTANPRGGVRHCIPGKGNY